MKVAERKKKQESVCQRSKIGESQLLRSTFIFVDLPAASWPALLVPVGRNKEVPASAKDGLSSPYSITRFPLHYCQTFRLVSITYELGPSTSGKKAISTLLRAAQKTGSKVEHQGS
jgi:hypothetical protein